MQKCASRLMTRHWYWYHLQKWWILLGVSLLFTLLGFMAYQQQQHSSAEISSPLFIYQLVLISMSSLIFESDFRICMSHLGFLWGHFDSFYDRGHIVITLSSYYTPSIVNKLPIHFHYFAYTFFHLQFVCSGLIICYLWYKSQIAPII